MNEMKRLTWKVNALMVFALISFIANIIFARLHFHSLTPWLNIPNVGLICIWGSTKLFSSIPFICVYDLGQLVLGETI